MMLLTHLAMSAFAVVMLAASGCGSTSTAMLSNDELVARADTICKRAEAARAALPKIKTRQDFGTVLSRAGTLQLAAVTELEKLTPPPTLAADWKQIVRVNRTLATYTGMYGQDVSAGNSRAARALLASAIALRQSVAATAQRDRFTACADITS